MKHRTGVALLISTVAWGCGGSDGPTRGSQCGQVLQVACSKLANTCQVYPPAEIPDCLQSGLAACCAGNCGAGVISTQEEIDTCIADINAATCTTIDVTNGGTLPPSCLGVVRSALTASTSSLLSSDLSAAGRLGRLLSD